MDWRWVVATVVFVGSGLTIWGLVSAYFSARRAVSSADVRISDSQELAAKERAEFAARTPAQVNEEFSAGIHDKYEILYADRDLIRPTNGNLPYLPAHESKRLLKIVLESTRYNLIWAGVGLLISTVAGVWSLWL